MNLLDGMKQGSLIENDNGSLYYSTSFNSNLDLFAAASRFNETEKNIANCPEIYSSPFNRVGISFTKTSIQIIYPYAKTAFRLR